MSLPAIRFPGSPANSPGVPETPTESVAPVRTGPPPLNATRTDSALNKSAAPYSTVNQHYILMQLYSIVLN